MSSVVGTFLPRNSSTALNNPPDGRLVLSMIHYGNISHDTLGVIWLAVSEKGLCAVRIGGRESEFLRSITDGQTDPLLDAESISTEAS